MEQGRSDPAQEQQRLRATRSSTRPTDHRWAFVLSGQVDPNQISNDDQLEAARSGAKRPYNGFITIQKSWQITT